MSNALKNRFLRRHSPEGIVLIRFKGYILRPFRPPLHEKSINLPQSQVKIIKIVKSAADGYLVPIISIDLLRIGSG